MIPVPAKVPQEPKARLPLKEMVAVLFETPVGWVTTRFSNNCSCPVLQPQALKASIMVGEDAGGKTPTLKVIRLTLFTKYSMPPEEGS